MRKPKPKALAHLQVYLQEHTLTQVALAKRLGISEAHCSRVVRGLDGPSLALAAKLERLTGIPARDFAGTP